MDGAGSGDNAVEVQSEQPPIIGAGIEYRSRDGVSNIDAALAYILPQESINHESQIFVRAINRTVILNVNLRCDSVEEVKRLIEEREGIPVTEQHLFFGGKPLRHGTFLRDYDTLGDQSTIDVSPRVRGGNGNRTRNMKLKELVAEVEPKQPMTDFALIPVQSKVQEPLVEKKMRVLTEFGTKIFHGVLTCVLSAHRAGLAYAGKCEMDNLMVYAYIGETGLVVSLRIYVVGDGIEPAPPPLELEDATQKKDYVALKKVIDELFLANPKSTEGSKSMPLLHVGKICKVLASLAGQDPPVYDLESRTHVLQAHAAMVCSPVAVATMCLNLKRLYDQFEKFSNKEREDLQSKFTMAMEKAKSNSHRICDQVKMQPMFKKVYHYVPNAGNEGVSLPNNQYDDSNPMALFNFARNWFTHVPPEPWPTTTAEYKGLPHLDYIFTYHFPDFMSEALLQLYKSFGDPRLLTQILVPVA